MRKLKYILVSTSLLSLFAIQTAMACPVCYTDPQSPTSDAVAYAVFALLGVTGTVLGGFASLFVYLRKRARKITLNHTVDFPSVN